MQTFESLYRDHRQAGCNMAQAAKRADSDLNGQIAAECERRFQAGGPRTYVYDPGTHTLAASQHGHATALFYAVEGQTVWTRAKIRKSSVYGWKSTEKEATT